MFDRSISTAKIRVVGVGGAGSNAINSMIESGVNADFYAVNTDRQSLGLSIAENKIQIGEEVAQGLGAGSDPDLGRRAAEESIGVLEEMCEGVKLLFIAAGMGGGTGTGAAPVIAKIAKEKGCLTVAVVTKPFAFEGKKRQENAEIGLDDLKKYVDMLIVVPNAKLVQTLPVDTTMLSAFKIADDYLRMGVSGIVDLINTPSLINLDFADLRTIIQNQGIAHMGRGRAKGEGRILEAMRKAVSSPLLETTIEGAHHVIINITGGTDLTLGQVDEAAGLVRNVVADSANIIFGTNINPDLNGEVDITIIATGFGANEEAESAQSAAAKGNPKQALDMLMGVNVKQEEFDLPPQKNPDRNGRRESENDEDDGMPSFAKKYLGGNRN
ncbi:MAG: cell division protein FtsZ [Clostridia bacterium]|nr:cell division protein FtsZ [Clostridia bacterium]